MPLPDGVAGRPLYMPNIVLWDERACDLNYAPAPPDRIALPCDVYRVVISTSTRAAEKLDALAPASARPARFSRSSARPHPGQPRTGTSRPRPAR
jgi:hypothetical protein